MSEDWWIYQVGQVCYHGRRVVDGEVNVVLRDVVLTQAVGLALRARDFVEGHGSGPLVSRGMVTIGKAVAVGFPSEPRS